MLVYWMSLALKKTNIFTLDSASWNSWKSQTTSLKYCDVFSQVMEQRHAESQALLLDESRAASEQGSSVHHAEPTRRSGGVQQEAAAFNLNLSFEELSGAGLEEPPRYCNNSQWPVCLLLKSLVEINHNSVCELCVCLCVCTSYSPIYTCKQKRGFKE